MRFVWLVALATTACGAVQVAAGGFTDPPVARLRTGELQLLWHQRIADEFDIDFRPNYRGFPAIDAARHAIYVGSIDHGMYSLRDSDGAVIWRFETLARVDAEPLVDGDTLYVGSQDGAVYALSTSDGHMLWRFATPAEVVRTPVVRGDTLFALNANDTLYALAKADGTQRWRYRRSSAGGISLTGHAGLVVRDRRVYSAYSDGVIACLDATDGSVVWEVDTSQDLENIEERNEGHQPIDVDTTPIVLEDAVYAASYAAGVYALDANSGNRRWRIDDLSSVAGLVSDGRYLYATSETSGLVKIDPFDGTVVWARNLGSSSLGMPAVLSGGRIAVPLADRGLWIVRSSDGEPVDGLMPGTGFAGGVATDGTRLFGVSTGGVVYAMSVRH